jgi:hypothetical protein
MVGDENGEHRSGELDSVLDLAVELRGAVGAGVAKWPPRCADSEEAMRRAGPSLGQSGFWVNPPTSSCATGGV